MPRFMEGMVLGTMGGYLVGWQFGWPIPLVALIGTVIGMFAWTPIKRMTRRMIWDV